MATAAPPTTVPTSDNKAAAIKTRILTHMSADHADSLALYLRHYSRLPSSYIPLPPAPHTLQMDDITLTHFTITHPSGRNLIPFDPPMKSFAESRTRLVEMHQDCLRALGLQDVRVTRFVWPNQIYQWVTHVLALGTYIGLGLGVLLGSGSLRYENGGLLGKVYGMGGFTPGLARFADDWARPVLLGMMFVHTAECGWMSRTRLRPYWIERGTGLWWKWIVCCFVGGVAAQWRFDEEVRDVRRKEKKEDH